MRRDINKIVTWIECPIKSLILKKQDNSTLTNLKRVFLYYYYSLQYSPRVKSETYLKKWYSKLDKIPITQEELLTTKRNDKKITDNVMVAEKIHEFCVNQSKQKIFPIAIEQNYNIKVGKIFVTGSIDLIREKQEEKETYIEIVKFDTNEKAPTKHSAFYDFALMMDVLAFRKLFLKKEDRIVIHHIATGNELIIKNEDYQMKWFQETLSIVAKDMADNIIYPRYSNKCGSCICRNECIKYMKGKKI